MNFTLVAVHTATEDIVLYPVLEKYYPNIVKHNHADHHHIKEALHKLFSMKISDHGYDDILAKAIKVILHHLYLQIHFCILKFFYVLCN